MKRAGILFSIFLILGLLASCQRGTEDPPGVAQGRPAPPERLYPVKVARPKVRPLTHFGETIGSFLAEREAQVASEIAGVIQETLVDQGSRVRKGDPLLRIAQERPRLEAQRAQARLERAETTLRYLEARRRRKESLLQEGIIGRQEYDDAAGEVEVAQAELRVAREELALAQKALRDTEVRSPLDGVVSQRHVSAGEYVEEGERLFYLVGLSPLKLRFPVPDRFAGLVHLGQEIRIRLPAYPDEELRGRISFISPDLDEQTRNLSLEARFANADERLKPGFFADVFFILGEKKEALVVPEAALLIRKGEGARPVEGREPPAEFRPHDVHRTRQGSGRALIENPDAFVFVVGVPPLQGRGPDRVARRREVTTGLTVGREIEILSGLKPDEWVVVEGAHELPDGARVKVLEEGRPR